MRNTFFSTTLGLLILGALVFSGPGCKNGFPIGKKKNESEKLKYAEFEYTHVPPISKTPPAHWADVPRVNDSFQINAGTGGNYPYNNQHSRYSTSTHPVSSHQYRQEYHQPQQIVPVGYAEHDVYSSRVRNEPVQYIGMRPDYTYREPVGESSIRTEQRYNPIEPGGSGSGLNLFKSEPPQSVDPITGNRFSNIETNVEFIPVRYVRQFDDFDFFGGGDEDEDETVIPAQPLPPIPQAIDPVPVPQNNGTTAPQITGQPYVPLRVPPIVATSQNSAIRIDPSIAEDSHFHEMMTRHSQNVNRPYHDTWRPAKIKGYWPQDEYVVDGGDDRGKVTVRQDWTVDKLTPEEKRILDERNPDRGTQERIIIDNPRAMNVVINPMEETLRPTWIVDQLEPEDTVAHFDTIDGRTLVSPSNRVHVYSPRFVSVRQVSGLERNDGRLQVTAALNTQEVDRNYSHVQSTRKTQQDSKAAYARKNADPGRMNVKNVPSGLDGGQSLMENNVQVQAIAYASLMTQAKLDGLDMLQIAEGSRVALTWTGKQGVHVRINSSPAYKMVGAEGPAEFFAIENGNTEADLRLIKIASSDTAQPGEIIEFMIRFDNIGTQPIGNVTILDSLSSRLELVPESAMSSKEASFKIESPEFNTGAPFDPQRDTGNYRILRWEITEPMKPLDYGVIKFKCIVR